MIRRLYGKDCTFLEQKYSFLADLKRAASYDNTGAGYTSLATPDEEIKWIESLQEDPAKELLPDHRDLPFLLIAELPQLRELCLKKMKAAGKMQVELETVDQHYDALQDLVKWWRTDRGRYEAAVTGVKRDDPPGTSMKIEELTVAETTRKSHKSQSSKISDNQGFPDAP